MSGLRSKDKGARRCELAIAEVLRVVAEAEALRRTLALARVETEKEQERADKEKRRADELAERVKVQRAGLRSRALVLPEPGTAEDTRALALELERRGTYEALQAEVARLAAENTRLQGELSALGEKDRAAAIREERLREENTRLTAARDAEWATAIREAANCVAPRPAEPGFRVHSPADRPRCGCSPLRALLSSPSDPPASDKPADCKPPEPEVKP